jgi:RND family efflux transporter MFP subunit
LRRAGIIRIGITKEGSGTGRRGPSDAAMKRRTLVLLVIAVAVAAGIAIATRGGWWSGGAVAQAPPGAGPRPVPVEIARAVKKPVPLTLDALGTVTPIASVAIKPRVESVILEVHFRDGAEVKQGDLLFTLDSRQIEAEIKRVEAIIAGALAQLHQAERDVQRYSELIAKNATTQVTLNNAQTQANISRATAESSSATLQNLKVQLDFTRIRAPISGRISAAAVKAGNFVRPSDSGALATIIQLAPVYVTFMVPQRALADVRQALGSESGTVEATMPGSERRAKGHVTMIENTVDAATGMVAVRATMPNTDELLWPGTLVTTQLTLRVDEAVTVPSAAVQVGQSGNFVFVIENDVAKVQPVKVARTFRDEAVLESGLDGGEIVVTDGQLLLTPGSRVTTREPKAGS